MLVPLEDDDDKLLGTDEPELDELVFGEEQIGNEHPVAEQQ